jgi:hypothetical protein
MPAPPRPRGQNLVAKALRIIMFCPPLFHIHCLERGPIRPGCLLFRKYLWPIEPIAVAYHPVERTHRGSSLSLSELALHGSRPRHQPAGAGWDLSRAYRAVTSLCRYKLLRRISMQERKHSRSYPRGLVQGERRVAGRYHHQHTRLQRPRHRREAERQAQLQVREALVLRALSSEIESR